MSGTKPAYHSTGADILALYGQTDGALLQLTERELNTSAENIVVRNTLPTIDLAAAADFAAASTPFDGVNDRWEEGLTVTSYTGTEYILDGSMGHDRFIGIIGASNIRPSPLTHKLQFESGAQQIDIWQLQAGLANAEDPSTLADEPILYKKTRRVKLGFSSTFNGTAVDNLILLSRVSEPAGERIAPGRAFT